MKILTLFILMTLYSCGIYKTEMVNGKIEGLEYQNIYIEHNNYSGVIFSKEYDPFGIQGIGNKFTPTMADIDSAEYILRHEIKEINKNRPNQGRDCPVIHKNLSKYKRQYFGRTENGEKIIYINCFWTNNYSKVQTYWKTEEVNVLDGCSFFWSIKVNLTRKFLFEFGVNGSA